MVTVVMIKAVMTEKVLTCSGSCVHLFPFAGCTAVNAVQASA